MKQAVCVMLILGLLCLTGCQRRTQETFFAMDTVMDLQVWDADSEEAVQSLKQLIADTERLWSAQREDSLVSALNRGEAVEDPLLEQVQSLSERTDGAFDPRLYELMRLWGFPSKQYLVPTQEEIDRAGELQLWDLGGAVKGYTGDLAVRQLAALDIDRAILNLGGNVQTYGSKPDAEPWCIGIQDPDGGNYLGVVSVVGTMAVVTSGDYQRYFEQGGVRYHHILDPKTGRPARSGLSSVTVICRNGLTADALSTALFVMGLESGCEFWRQSDDFEAIFVTAEGGVYATEGAALSGCEYEVIRREN